jgi:hypothetical protein
VSYTKIGDVLVAQGNLPEAMKSFRDGLAMPTGWRNPIPQCGMAARSFGEL